MTNFQRFQDLSSTSVLAALIRSARARQTNVRKMFQEKSI